MKKTLIFIIVVLSYVFGYSQKNKTLLELESNELTYLLTYLNQDDIKTYNDEGKSYFSKAFKVFTNDYRVSSSDKKIYKYYYYFLVGNNDSILHFDAKLYKTEALLLPKIERIEDSEKKDKFIAIISYQKPQNEEIIDLQKRDTIQYEFRKYGEVKNDQLKIIVTKPLNQFLDVHINEIPNTLLQSDYSINDTKIYQHNTKGYFLEKEYTQVTVFTNKRGIIKEVQINIPEEFNRSLYEVLVSKYGKPSKMEIRDKMETLTDQTTEEGVSVTTYEASLKETYSFDDNPIYITWEKENFKIKIRRNQGSKVLSSFNVSLIK